MGKKVGMDFFIKLLILGWGLSFLACTSQSPNSTDYQFELLEKDRTGLDFENTLRPTSDFNIFNYLYFYNGGGIAAADFDKNGLVDLFFTNNMGPNQLFLNQGNFQFKNVTQAAQLGGLGGWTSGASVVDINNDGLLDIYVSQLGDYQSIKGRNQLYVCQGIVEGVPVFQDMAIEYGLALVGFATQATFFDYDLDGDLDLFQLNHSTHYSGTFGQKQEFEGTIHPLAGDKLFRNDDGQFVEVTIDAGIRTSAVGYGLGVVVGDINLDGWPDIYVGNDFHEDDYLYLNQQNGTFREVLREQMMHCSRFTMGVDMADINNDGFQEVVSLDMHPYDPLILKSSQTEQELDVFNFRLHYGYGHQYARNNLQLNNTDGTFSEIGRFADVYATDWSWSALFFDFDHDGYKDLFVSNGIPRRFNDLDYIKFKADSDLRFKANTNNMDSTDLRLESKMPEVKLPNKFFRNNGQLRFEDISGTIKNSQPSFSHGAIYADLDNDGDLDIVVNNNRAEPYIYNNLTIEKQRPQTDYLALALKGPAANLSAIGSRVLVFKGTEKLYQEHYPVRGFQSSMLSTLHVGVKDAAAVDSVLLIWPDNSYEVLRDIPFNRTIDVAWKSDLPLFSFDLLHSKASFDKDLKDVTDEVNLHFEHQENRFIEFKRESLIPHMVSSEGPALAVGDVNGDGLDDVFIGGAKWQSSALFVQRPNGQFEDRTPATIHKDSTFEEVDAVFADIENDGDLDLIVASGGNEFWADEEERKPGVYLNDGNGNFGERQALFPGALLTASCLLPADFNGDGFVDFFIGARAIPWRYGERPVSYLFENKGNGEFEDVTAAYSESLQRAGLVKDGLWADMNGDGTVDLVLAMEWDAIQIFWNKGDRFEQQAITDRKGWWNTILIEDFDNDGDLDLLAGNLGKNAELRASDQEPVKLYVSDFDDNGQAEPILTCFLQGREIPFANYDELTGQLPSLKKQFLYAKDFAKASLEDLLGREKLEQAIQLSVNTFEHVYFENLGSGLDFKAHILPDELQLSTLNAFALLEGEGASKEVIAGGNFYDNNIEMGRYDASFGNLLSIRGTDFGVHPLGALNIKGQVRRILPIKINGKNCFVFAKNDDAIQIVQIENNQTLTLK